MPFPGAKGSRSIEAEVFHNKIEDFRNRAKPRPYDTDKRIVQLREEGIEILNSQLDRQTVVVWIWCRSQTALEIIQVLYESNQLKEFFEIIFHSAVSKVINIDRNHFKNTVGKFTRMH